MPAKPGRPKGSLLRRLEDLGKSFLVLKDFTSVLTLHRDARAEILAQLRELYDGQYTKDFGTGEGVTWEGRLGLLAAVTPVIDAHHGVISVLGDRFTYVRLPPPARQELGARALDESGSEAEMRAELRAAVTEFMAGLPLEDAPRWDVETRSWLVCLANLTTWCRSGVQRDQYSSTRDIVAVPQPELPARFVKQLGQLWRALVLMRCTIEEAQALVVRVACDSAPPDRMAVLRFFAEMDGEATTPAVADAVALPTNTAMRVLEDLAALRLLVRRAGPGGRGGAHKWLFSEEGAALWVRAGL